jgi:hypothetical protein
MPAKYEDLVDVIDRVAKRVAADYPDIEWVDVRQELALFVITNGESIKLRDDGGNPTWLLNRVAQTYCLKVRTQHMSLSPQYAYRPSDVKKILETAFSVENVMQTYVPDDAVSMKGLDEVEIASDVKAAYDRLNQEEKTAVFRRYALGEVPDNASYERKKLNAAIKKLTHKLNTYRGRGPDDRRMRRVMSNASANAALSENYYG